MRLYTFYIKLCFIGPRDKANLREKNTIKQKTIFICILLEKTQILTTCGTK